LLDFSAGIYDAVLRLEFLRFLRPELKFPNAGALIAQMRNDEENARLYFQG
jgi:FAD synthase